MSFRHTKHPSDNGIVSSSCLEPKRSISWVTHSQMNVTVCECRRIIRSDSSIFSSSWSTRGSGSLWRSKADEKRWYARDFRSKVVWGLICEHAEKENYNRNNGERLRISPRHWNRLWVNCWSAFAIPKNPFFNEVNRDINWTIFAWSSSSIWTMSGCSNFEIFKRNFANFPNGLSNSECWFIIFKNDSSTGPWKWLRRCPCVRVLPIKMLFEQSGCSISVQIREERSLRACLRLFMHWICLRFPTEHRQTLCWGPCQWGHLRIHLSILSWQLQTCS